MMVSEERKLINAIQPKKMELQFDRNTDNLVVPNLSGITGNKDAMNKLTLQKVTDNGNTTSNDIIITDATHIMRMSVSGGFGLLGTTTNTSWFFQSNNVSYGKMDSSGRLNWGSSANAPASAALSVTSTSRGFLPPVMTSAQKNAISSPAAGLIVYDTDLGKLCVRTAAAWETITSA